VRWTIFKRRISDQQTSTGGLGLARPQATAQLDHFGAQLGILLTRVMLSPPQKGADDEQYHQGSFEPHTSSLLLIRAGAAPVAGGYLLSSAWVSMSYKNHLFDPI
jgi:hypothetical protein